MKDKINIICGTTASGKTSYAVKLAKKLGAVIINADSMQIYKEIPILTAQPTITERQDIEHFLYGFIECGAEFSVAVWLDKVTALIDTYKKQDIPIILVGGTGLYIQSLVRGISTIPKIAEIIRQKVRAWEKEKEQDIFTLLQAKDPVSAAKLKPNDRQRILRALEVYEQTGKPITFFQEQGNQIFYPRDKFHLIRLHKDRELIYNNINKRFENMIAAGAIEEIRTLRKIKPNAIYPKAHGLYEIIAYLKGQLSLEDCIKKAQQNTRNYAKRQLTWLNHQLTFDQEIT